MRHQLLQNQLLPEFTSQSEGTWHSLSDSRVSTTMSTTKRSLSSGENFTNNQLPVQLTLLKTHLIEVDSMRRDFFKRNNVNFYEEVSGIDISEFANQ